MDLIVQKTAILLQLCEALQEENDLLRLELELLQADSERTRLLEGSDEDLAEINEKKLDRKQKIDDFVREIDWCIGLLKTG